MSDVEIYYLNWDKEKQERGPASELFHDLHGFDDDAPVVDSEDFEDLYREVASVEGDYSDPEELWREWNRGSGYESQSFLDQEERSMSVGDVVRLDDEYFQVRSIGFEQLDIEGDQQ